MKKYYNVDLNKADAEKFRHYLREQGIYFEPSGAAPLVHFECKMTPDEAGKANEFLATL